MSKFNWTLLILRRAPVGTHKYWAEARGPGVGRNPKPQLLIGGRCRRRRDALKAIDRYLQ